MFRGWPLALHRINSAQFGVFVVFTAIGFDCESIINCMTDEFPLRISSAIGYLSDMSNANRRASWPDDSGFFAEVAEVAEDFSK
jgi:hypothetical protein